MAIDYVLLRTRRSELTVTKREREQFAITLRKNIDPKKHKKLGLYDATTSKIEEWCHKEDFEFYTQK
jgi:hypothetical protein